MKRSLTLITVVAMLGVAVPVASGAVRLPGFRSPSRNIKCLYVPGSGVYWMTNLSATLAGGCVKP